MGKAHLPPKPVPSWRGRLLGKLRSALLATVAVVGCLAFAGTKPAEASLGDGSRVVHASVALRGGSAVRAAGGATTQFLLKGIAYGVGTAVGARVAPYVATVTRPVLRPLDRLVVAATPSLDGRSANAAVAEFVLVEGQDVRAARRVQGFAARAHLPVGPYEIDGIYQRYGGLTRYRVHSTIDPSGFVRQVWSPIDASVWQADLHAWGAPVAFEGTMAQNGRTLVGHVSLMLGDASEAPVEVPATFVYSGERFSDNVVTRHAPIPDAGR